MDKEEHNKNSKRNYIMSVRHVQIITLMPSIYKFLISVRYLKLLKKKKKIKTQ